MEEAERMERRERDKRERAKMSLIQNQEAEPEMLFAAPFRVSVIIIPFFFCKRRKKQNFSTFTYLWNLFVYKKSNREQVQRKRI